MTCNATQGVESGFAIAIDKETGAAYDWADLANDVTLLEVLNFGVQKQPTILESEGLRGTRSRPVERTNEGNYDVGGGINLNPSCNMLDYLLPAILGVNHAGVLGARTFYPAEGLPLFGLLANYKPTGTDMRSEFTNLQVNTATFAGNAGELVTLGLDAWGIDELEGSTAQAWPAVALGNTNADRPLVVAKTTINIAGTDYDCMNFNLSINNALNRRFSTGSLSATSVCSTDRQVNLSVQTPLSQSEFDDLYETYRTTPLSIFAVTITMQATDASNQVVINLPYCEVTTPTPSVGGRGEVPLPLTLIARTSGDISVNTNLDVNFVNTHV